MGGYDKLIEEIANDDVIVIEKHFKSKAKGLCKGRIVAVSKALSTSYEKTCVLAEELGHYYTTSGNILDQTKIINRKQEKRARAWAYERLMPLSSLIKAYEQGIQNRYELSVFLDVTEKFIDEALKYYKDRYGLYIETGDYTIMFEPSLSIIKKVISNE